MEKLSDSLLYSDSRFNKLNNSHSTVSDITDVFRNLTDLMPNTDYRPYYISRYQELGVRRFTQLANKARIGKNPEKLFCWMLNHNELVK